MTQHNTDTEQSGPLELLVQGRHDLENLARETNIDLRELGRWAMEPDNARTLTGLLRLADARTQLALGRYRMIAANKLAQMTTAEESDDLVRKACVDLLTIDSTLAPAPEEDQAAMESALQPPRPSPEAILRAFDKMAEGTEFD